MKDVFDEILRQKYSEVKMFTKKKKFLISIQIVFLEFSTVNIVNRISHCYYGHLFRYLLKKKEKKNVCSRERSRILIFIVRGPVASRKFANFQRLTPLVVPLESQLS